MSFEKVPGTYAWRCDHLTGHSRRCTATARAGGLPEGWQVANDYADGWVELHFCPEHHKTTRGTNHRVVWEAP